MDNTAAIKERLRTLSPAQRTALMQELARRRQSAAAPPVDDGPYPLSLAQRRLWMLSQLGNAASAAYNISAAFCFDQALEPQHLQAAWRRLLARHPVLRSAFLHAGDSLLQLPRAVDSWQLQRHLLLPGVAVEDQLQQLAASAAMRPFHLQDDWLVRVTYCEPAAGTARGATGIIIVIHHIVCDGLSIATMVRELAQLYQEAVTRTAATLAPVLQYRDYVAHAAGSEDSEAIDYWRQRFASPPETLDALLDLPRPPLQDFTGACVTLTLPQATQAGFEALCRSQQCTLYMGLVAVVQLLLARCANAGEVTLGTPVAGRPGTRFDGVVGPFINTIALRQPVDRSGTFVDLLQQVRRTVLAGFEHQGLAFDALVSALGLESDPSRSPLYDAMIGLNSADEMTLAFGTSRGRPVRIPHASSKVDLTFHFERQDDGSLRLDLEYASSVLLPTTAERLCETWGLLMAAVTAQPLVAVGDYALQTADACRLLIEGINATARPYPRDSSLASEFRRVAARFPEAIAVHAGDVQLSYRELDAASERLARVLQHHPGFAPGGRVALMLEKDARVLSVILAIVKSGCTYVPLAANTPQERVSQIVAASEVRLIFAETTHLALLQALDVQVLDTDGLLRASAAAGAEPSPATAAVMAQAQPQVPAYLMFTSGSTGLPKGTLIEQRSVLRLVCNTDYHQVQANERVLLTGSLAFDAATFEIWGPLLNGGCVCVPAGTTLLEVQEFGALVAHYRVDTAFLTTGLFNQLVDHSADAFGCLRTVLTGGEKISVEHVRKLLRAHPLLALLHVYGPTENTTFSTWHRITADDLALPTVPIGRPIANSRIYLLDQQLRAVPIGVPGEIYCGGDGVARGYLVQQDDAARALEPVFLPDPFLPPGKGTLYRTGDLAKWSHRRELVFLGRNDRQVKIRGFRVELAEVEYQLRTLTDVTDAFAALRSDAGNSELVAWLVVPAETHLTIVAVREALKQRLPNYMLPAKIVCLQRLPLNASGKVDARALPLPKALDRPSQPAVQLHGRVEEELAALYAQVLGLGASAAHTIARDANFFSLGGDSIRAIQLVSLARAAGYQFTLKDIFAADTLAGLAALAQSTAPIRAQPALQAGPLSPTQHWWLEQAGMPAAHFNLSSVFRVAGKVDMVALEAALDALLELHPALRLRLDRRASQQVIRAQGRYVLRQAASAQAREQCWQELQAAIDLDAGILLAVGVAAAVDTSFIAIVVHHLAADEVSGRLFAENLQRLYQAALLQQRGAGRGACLPPLRETLGIADWAAQLEAAVQRGALDRDLPYWRAVVARGRRILQEQPQLFAVTPAARGSAAILLPAAPTQVLQELGTTQLRMTMQELLLAAFIRAWQRTLGTSDCLLSLEGHGREQVAGLPDCSTTLGWFTSLYPFAYVGTDADDANLYRNVKDAVRRLPSRGFSYLPLCYYRDAPTRSALVLRPLISFNYLGAMQEEPQQWLHHAREQAGADHGATVIEPFRLDVLARITEGSCELILQGEAPTTALTVDALGAAWCDELEGLAASLTAGTGADAPLSLADSLVPFATLAEFDRALSALHVPAASVEEILPLTGMQSGMWLHCRRDPNAYQDQVALRLQQPLESARFAAAVTALVAETQALRTGFAQAPNGELLQIVWRERTAAYRYLDAREWQGDIDLELARLRAEQRGGNSDLLCAPLFRLTLVRLAAESFELIIDFHHLVIDGWTSALLLQRLESLYFADGTSTTQAASGMRRYFEWLGQQSTDAPRAYWQELLGDYQGHAEVPAHLPRAPTAVATPLFVETRIGADLHRRLRDWCRQHGVTLNAAVQTLWGVFLGRLTGSDDVVFGATVSGRDIDLAGVENIAGMLINTLPVRVQPEPDMSFASLVQHTARQFAASMACGHVALAEIMTLAPARAALVSHTLVFENYPAAGEAARWHWMPQDIFDPMHFEFGVIVAPLADDLSFRFVADGSLYVRERLHALGVDLSTLLATLLDDAAAQAPAPAAIAGWSLSANFTADPLVPLLQFHEHISGNSGAVTLLPYDQSVQLLLNPASRLRRLPAHHHVVLWRPPLDDSSAVSAAAFEQLEQLAVALASYARESKGSRIFIVPCLWFGFDRTAYREFVAYLKGALAGVRNAEVVGIETLPDDYALQESCYPPALVFGDIPYTEEFFAALANRLARLRDLQARPPVKVYVVDADDTLWGGVVGEDGVRGIRLDSVHLQLQERLLQARAAGALICLATKNNEDDVHAVFEQREMRLRRDHLTRVCAGWRPKSESILALAAELGLGLDSFVFIDDSPLECAEVLSACPGVIVQQLPPAATRGAFLTHAWLLDARVATREDAARAQMYADELQRVDARKASGSYAEFLAALDIRVDMRALAPADIARVAQLSQRTNQFNTTGIRYTEAELSDLLQAPQTLVRCVRVQDKYGDYGLVGCLFARRAEQAWTVTGLLLSCRVLGRGVEHTLLRELAQEAAAAGAHELRVDFVKLPRNAPALQFLQSLKGGESAAAQQRAACAFTLIVAGAAGWQPGDVATVTDSETAAPVAAATPERLAFDRQSGHRAARLSLYHRQLAAELNSGGTILQAMQRAGVFYAHARAAHGTAGTPPATATEAVLAGFFTELLGAIEVCRQDSFHALGGHSLKAMMLFARIAARYGVTFDFQDLQAHPTLAQLAAALDAAIPHASDTTVPVLAAVPTADSYAAAPGQSRLWMLEQIRGEGPSPFHMHATLVIAGNIDRPALDQALWLLCRRHEALRTCFHQDAQGRVRQVITPGDAADIRVHWLAGLLDLAAAEAYAQAQCAAPFDISKAPLWRLAAGGLASGGNVLFITVHHSISDGWSMGIFARELSALYRDCRVGSQQSDLAATLQFRDFAAWQLAWLDAAAGIRAEQFWREHFATPVEPLQLPGLVPRPPVLRSEGLSCTTAIARQTWSAYTRRLAGLGVSHFAGLFAAWQLVLARLSRQQNFCIGTAVAGRQHAQLEGVIGFFANVIPLRTTLDAQHTVESFLQAAAGEVNACLSYQGVPFDRIVASLALERDPGRAPLFDVLLVLQDTPEENLQFDGQVARLLPMTTRASQYDLTLNAFPAADGSLQLVAEYNSILYSSDHVGLMLRCLLRVLQALTAAGTEALGDLPWLADTDLAAVRAFEGVNVDAEAEWLPDFVRAAVAPPGACIRDAAGAWSYTELQGEMERIAGLLLAAQHAGRTASDADTRQPLQVGVIGTRSKRSVAALLGVMDAGAVYVPLDLTNPPERLRAIVAEGGIDLLLSTDTAGEMLAGTLQQQHSHLVHVRYEDIASATPCRTAIVNTAAIAYMIFTSGSTGKPKGVQISHASFATMIRQQILAFDVQPHDVCGQFAALSFDASLSEIFLALATGASLAVAPDEARTDTESFMHWLRASRATVLTLPPAFLRALDRRDLAPLRVLITAGEAAVPEDLRHYAQQLRVLNAYGPTETSVCASVYQVDARHVWPFGVPIGAPLPGVLLTVRDAALARVPIGVVGELFIGGATVGAGYYAAVPLSAQKFISLADTGPAVRWYRSGDLVRWRADGLLEYIGRSDNQIKVRGYRIEPGEIEHVARAVAGIEDALVLVHPVLGLWLYGVVGASTPVQEQEIFKSTLLTELGRRLPRYMVPGGVELLEAFPVSPAGKVDREALLASASALQRRFEAPVTAAESALAQAWERALQLERIGRHDDFFALGGDSIKALTVVSALRAYGFSCGLKDFFSAPCLLELALALVPCAPTVPWQQSISGDVPLLPIQQWFLRSRAADAARQFHIVAEVGIAEDISILLLQRCVAALAEHHDALRACFYQEDGQWRQAVSAALDVDSVLAVYRHTGAEAADRAAIAALACHPFDLARAGLCRFVLVQDTGGRGVAVVIALHHLIADFVSLRILVADLNALVTAAAQGRAAIEKRRPPHLLRELAQRRNSQAPGQAPADAEYRKALTVMAAWPEVWGCHRDLHTYHLRLAPDALAALLQALQARSVRAPVPLRLQDLMLAAVGGVLSTLLTCPTVPVMVESHGRDDSIDLSRQVAWLTRARLINLDLAELQGPQALERAHDLLQRDHAGPDLFACASAGESVRKSLPALLSFNYLGDFGAGGARDSLFSLRDTVFEQALAPESPIDVPLHVEFYVLDKALEIQIAASARLVDPVRLQACWQTLQARLLQVLAQ